MIFAPSPSLILIQNNTQYYADVPISSFLNEYDEYIPFVYSTQHNIELLCSCQLSMVRWTVTYASVNFQGSKQGSNIWVVPLLLSQHFINPETSESFLLLSTTTQAIPQQLTLVKAIISTVFRLSSDSLC